MHAQVAISATPVDCITATIEGSATDRQQSMNCSPTLVRNVASAQAPAVASSEPVAAYRGYCDAIQRRDSGAVLAALSDSCAQSLFDLDNPRDFAAFFQMWCASQQETVVVVGSHIEGAVATVQARTDTHAILVRMQLQDGRWRIIEESYKALRREHT